MVKVVGFLRDPLFLDTAIYQVLCCPQFLVGEVLHCHRGFVLDNGHDSHMPDWLLPSRPGPFRAEHHSWYPKQWSKTPRSNNSLVLRHLGVGNSILNLADNVWCVCGIVFNPLVFWFVGEVEPIENFQEICSHHALPWLFDRSLAP